MNRSACPSCKCGFAQNPALFPTLTNTRVQAVLGSINSVIELTQFLKNEGISLSDKDGKIHFPSGVCMRIREKFITKMSQLGIDISKNNLFSRDQLLPATGVDDESLPFIGSGVPLDWDEDTTIEGTKKWIPIRFSWQTPLDLMPAGGPDE